jgi:nucleotide-binding universal stress UspA family protein
MRRILVAVDDSDASARVARFVNAFFSGFDAEVLAINVAEVSATWIPPVVGFGVMYPWPYSIASDHLNEFSRDAQQRAERMIAESQVRDDEAIVEFGEPAITILNAAAERDVDLIVVGSNHKGVFERLLDSSVSRKVLHEAKRPVLVVP